MKYLLTLFLIIFSLEIFAQDNRLDELEFDESEYDNKMKSAFALGFGYSATFLLTDLSPLENELRAKGVRSDKFPTPLFLNGFEVFTSVAFVKNLRVGLIGAGGRTFSETGSQSAGEVSFTNISEVKVNYTALSFDYFIRPIRSLPIAILPSVGIGWMRTNISVSNTPDTFDWGDLNSEVSDGYSYQITSPIGLVPNFVAPSVKIEWAFLDFAMLRGVVGYNYCYNYDWELNGNEALNNVPNDINANGLRFELGLFLGLFNY